MHIRVHTKNALDSSSDRRRHEETIVLEISFFLWLKSLFVGLDLCITSLMFPKEEPDEEQVNGDNDNESIKDNGDVSVSESNVGNKKHGGRKPKMEKPKPLSDIELYGIQWDDETVVYPDGRKVSCHVSSRTSKPKNDMKVIDEANSKFSDHDSSIVDEANRNPLDTKAATLGEANSDSSDNATSVVGEAKTGKDLMVNAERSVRENKENESKESKEIDFANPPHSNRWKARNLPPRKPFIPKY